jgi:hypothetical protein
MTPDSQSPSAPENTHVSTMRVYCDGKLTKQLLAAKLDKGLVLTDNVPHGYSGGDVAYFREGTPEEIEFCRAKLAESASPRAVPESQP